MFYQMYYIIVYSFVSLDLCQNDQRFYKVIRKNFGSRYL